MKKLIDKILYKFYSKIVCPLKGHLWAEWSQRPSRIFTDKEFFKGTLILKNPYCVRCFEKKYNCKKDEYRYRDQLKERGLLK